ncbi:MAG TPA: DNA-processing protein DprA [Elusimicrobiota bacterium]|nr:DNA-processing protein DprA [Elusimicrobiota bacterium]
MIQTAPSRRAAWAARLNAVAFLDSAKAWDLLETLGPDGLEKGVAADWAASAAVRPEPAARWRAEALAFDLDGERRRLEALGARLIVRGEPEYPRLLGSVPDAPLVLYAWGRLDDLPAAAVVGARAPTVYGRRMARRLAADFARRRVAVVSGLARGIDSEAHEAALNAGGATWAVLGSGLGQVYPPENRELARRIAEEGGCVLSEFPLAVAPHRANFPRRNRIVAGLCEATIVVEGRARSGSLLTAGDAAQYGREVYAVPGPADSPLSDGPHKLLRSGARLATRVEDVTSLFPTRFGACPSVPREGGPGPSVTAEEAQLLRHLGSDSLSLEELARLTALDMPALSLIMFGLEIKELVSAVPGQRYAKKTLS